MTPESSTTIAFGRNGRFGSGRPEPSRRSRRRQLPEFAWITPRKQTGTIEILFWAIMIFLVTSPLTFWLMQVDPTLEVRRNLSEMRQADSSQWRLYLVRAIVLGSGLFFAMPRLHKTIEAWPRLVPFLPFLAWAALSLIWTDYFATTLNSIAAMVALILASFFMGLRVPYGALAKAALLGGALVAIGSIAISLGYPSYGVHQHEDFAQSIHAGAWRGLYAHKNHLGQTMAVFATGAIFAGQSIISSPVVKWSLVALLLGVMLLSTSVSAMLVVPTAIAMTWYVVLLSRGQRLRALTYLVPGVIIGLLLLSYIFEAMGRDMTLTGRTEVWRIAFEWVADRPLLGWGYNTLTYGGFSFELLRARGVVDPHNAFIEAVLGTGIIGLVLFVIPIAAACRSARRHQMAGGMEAQSALVFSAMTMAWIMACFTEVDGRPFSSAGAVGIFALTILLTMPNRGGTASGTQAGDGAKSSGPLPMGSYLPRPGNYG
ncbi:hypothetical protein BH10PSE13_BH10PSE13_13080 [soil metagenome]